MVVYNNLNESIRELLDAISELNKNKDKYNDDKLVIELFYLAKEVYNSQIHEYLVAQNSEMSEKEIRYHVNRIDKTIIPFLETKLKEQSVSIESKGTYLELYDAFYALASFRNLQRFAEYMEFDLPQVRKILTMASKNNLVQPIFYTSQRMVLDGAVKKLFKNTPTGYFKSYSDVIIISWILGYNPNADCLKVVGNPKMVTKTINGVSDMLLKKRYSNVFPFYKQYEENKQKMFRILAPGSGEMLLANTSGIDFSLLCISKDTSIDGGRYKYRFYDDITNSKYKTNITMHNSDDTAYNDQWKKRKYTEFDDCEWFTGTVYYYLDFLSRRRNENGFDSSEPLKMFKYTKFNKEHKSIFVVIPKLDYETDECTFPEICSTEQARIDRGRDLETFQAMEQGLPLIPEGMPFDMKRMKQWQELPLKEEEGGNRSDFCNAVLDLPRTGANNLSLLVLSKCGELHYLVDAIYKKKPIDEKLSENRTVLDSVCEKLVQKKVKHLIVENNVCSNIKQQIEDKLKALHYSCSVEDFYTSTIKTNKIYDAQADIQDHIVLPANGIFANSSDVGKAVFDIITWSSSAKSDDSPDCLAMYVRHFIKSTTNYYATAKSFKR